MASNYWIKFFHETLNDPKMGRLPDNLWRRYWECCLMTSERQGHGRLPALPDIVWRLRVEEQTLRGEFEQMEQIGLLAFVADRLEDYWIVVNFAERQSKMSAAERKRQQREREKKREYFGPRHEPVTKRDIEKMKKKKKRKRGNRRRQRQFYLTSRTKSVC